jgi:hypothetical protein
MLVMAGDAATFADELQTASLQKCEGLSNGIPRVGACCRPLTGVGLVGLSTLPAPPAGAGLGQHVNKLGTPSRLRPLESGLAINGDRVHVSTMTDKQFRNRGTRLGVRRKDQRRTELLTGG